MPDTDDDQSVELEPEQREQGDDDTEAARERRAAQARTEADKHPTHDLAEEEAERQEAEDEQARQEEDAEARAEQLDERAAKEQQELTERRSREELLDATAETSRAFQLAYADEEARDRYRQYASNDVQRGISDRAHGRHELDEAAAHRDEAGSAGLVAEGRRYQNAATIEERKTVSDDKISREYDASARRHLREAQPNPSEAVRKAPEEAPEAQLPQARRHVRGPGRVRNKQGKVVKPNRASEPDLEI
ncbi:hypothetical protein EV649_5414 [Kribbella sp. VKM Ac-2569]|uniref:hypothetical protein n=1 Tax=Kribbella sp. VKM Ac-2569 TaxID=2512220 RepID=UPI00102AE4B9|nr:hypothetical protein [Kribbella sp. VKM Ac-2569]RZT14639.1 hypothetical protein EV649_5414 [Kribbella sp. VKM Ac-2569]